MLYFALLNCWVYLSADIWRMIVKYVQSYFTLQNKKLSYCWETMPRESMPRIAEMDVEMTT